MKRLLRRFLVNRREAAGDWWMYDSKCAHLLAVTPLASHADAALRRSRRRLAFWDFWLDIAEGHKPSGSTP